VKKLAFSLGLAVVLIAPAAAEEDCALEIRMFDRDVRVAREIKEHFSWKLVGANYRRRVHRYCTIEERRAAVARLKLTDEELQLMGIARE
jgi:hypothetical protein